MTRTVREYPIPGPGAFTLDLPPTAQVIGVLNRGAEAVLQTLEEVPPPRRFYLAGIGERLEFAGLGIIGPVQIDGQAYHLFEVMEQETG